MKKYRRVIFLVVASLFMVTCSVGKYAIRGQYAPLVTDYPMQGILEEVIFVSTEPGMTERRAFAYLPKDYYESGERYPVMYLLHGARGNECVWIEKSNLLQSIDSLTAVGAMLPTIVILPNVNQYNDDADYGKARLKSALESFYEVDGTVESRFVADVVGGTDAIYRTIPDKEHRAIAGLSIGAMQSIHISANFPDTFGYVGMFSPMVHSFLKIGPDNSFYRHLKAKQAVQFENPPILYSVSIGRSDFFEPSIRNWTRDLKSRGYDVQFFTAKGGHDWYNWEDFCSRFMQELWK